MKSVSLFYPYIEPHCPGVTVPMMRQALISSAIEFCERSLAAQEVTTGSLTEGTGEIDIELPSQQQFVMLLEVQYRDSWLQVVPTNEAPNVLYQPASGDPTHAYLADPHNGPITLYPTPANSESDVLFVRAAYAPTRQATQLADILFDDWIEFVAAGAIYRLQSQPSASFFSPTALASKAEFERGIAKAKVLAHRGRVRVSQRVQPRAFA